MPEIARNCPARTLLRPRQEAAAILVARGATGPEAASGSGAAERTVKVWLRRLDFRARVRELRRHLTEQAMGVLVSHMTAASDTMASLLEAKSEMVRLSAAKAIIELASKGVEIEELRQRIELLEGGKR